MKRGNAIFIGLIIMRLLSTNASAFSQEASGSKFSIDCDFYSSYIWRGTNMGLVLQFRDQ